MTGIDGGNRIGGWWRLWIVLAVGWGAALLGLTLLAGSWPTVATLPLDDELRDAYRHAHFDSTAKVYDAWADNPAVTLTPVDPFYTGVTGRMDDFHRRRIDSLTRIAASPATTTDTFIVLLRAKTGDQRSERLGGLVRVWLLPSLGLLAIGLGASWIWRGFRPRRDR